MSYLPKKNGFLSSLQGQGSFLAVVMFFKRSLPPKHFWEAIPDFKVETHLNYCIPSITKLSDFKENLFADILNRFPDGILSWEAGLLHWFPLECHREPLELSSFLGNRLQVLPLKNDFILHEEVGKKGKNGQILVKARQTSINRQNSHWPFWPVNHACLVDKMRWQNVAVEIWRKLYGGYPASKPILSL